MRLYFSRAEQYVVFVLLLAVLGGLFVLSYAYGRKQREAATATAFLEQPDAAEAGSPAITPDTAPSQELVIHIIGAVKQPGVYRFFPGARVDDAIRQAGGARTDGYADALNLAARLEDGMRICVPTRAEWTKMTAATPLPPLVVAGSPDPIHTPPDSAALTSLPTTDATSGAIAAGGSPARTGPKPLPTGKIALNTAGAEQLMTLPGIGPVTAQRILDYRAQQGKFTDLSQLLDVPGIGPKTYEKIEPHVML